MDISEILTNVLNFNNMEDNKNFFENLKYESNDFEKILKTVKILKIIQDEDTKIKLNEDENNLKNELSFNKIKKILSLIEIENQDSINSIIKFVEVKNFINKYKKDISQMKIKDKFELKKEVILSIKEKLENKNKPIVDAILKMLEVQNIIKNLSKRELLYEHQ